MNIFVEFCREQCKYSISNCKALTSDCKVLELNKKEIYCPAEHFSHWLPERLRIL